MSPDPRESFRTIFKRLDARARREFVAALYAARGWDTRLENGFIVATRNEQTRRIAVLQSRRFGTPSLPDVDVVIVTGDNDVIRTDAEATGVNYVTPADLRNLLLYGLGREKAADLFEAHFDRPLSTVESTSGTDGTATPLISRPSSPDLTARQVGVVVAVLLVGAVWLAGVGLLPGPESPTLLPESNRTSTPDHVGAIGGEREYPPGLGPEGVENSGILTEAHLQYLANQSYVYRISASGPQHAPFMTGLTSWNATVRIENAMHYQYRKSSVAPHGFHVEQRALRKGENVTVWEPIRNPSAHNNTGRELLIKQVYTNGAAKYWRFDGPEKVEYRHATAAQDGRRLFGVRDWAVASVDTYLQQFLWTDDSSIRCIEATKTDDCLTYRVEATGEPVEFRGDVADYRAVAVVEQSGFVRSLTVRYTLPRVENPEKRVQARFHLEYVAVGNETASITPPEWLDTAKNRTEGTATETATETKGTTTDTH